MTTSSPQFPLVGVDVVPRPVVGEPTGRPRLQRIRRKGPDRSGQLLDEQWELLRLIGSGGMGQVYHAFNHVDRRPYAVKIHSITTADPSAYDRFRHEFMVLRRAAHPHIVAAHAFVERGGECFYSMELLDGQSLSQASKDGPLLPERVILLGLQICEAVGHLHHLGVIHRDIKPNNIIVTQEGGRDHVKILDLGICKLTPRWYASLEERTDVDMRVHTLTGAPLGTPGYMIDDGEIADEVLRDVFGLGVTLFRIATGHLPYKRSTPRLGDEMEWTAADEERIPGALATVLRKAVALDPAVRYQAVTGDPSEITLRSELVQAGMEMGVIPCEEAEDLGRMTTSSPRAAGSSLPLAAAPPRRSMGWVVAAILGIYMVVDLGTAHFGVDVDTPAGERQPAAVAEREVGPMMEVAEVAETTRAPPPDDATAVSALAPTPSADASETIEVTAVAEDPPPRPRRRPLTATAFGEVVAPKRAALDRCARGLRDGPSVDAIVTISADGRALGVQLSPRGVSHFAQTCTSEVLTALHFPRTSADSTHTWPLHRPEGREE